MTVINQAELAELTRLDQALMWAIVSINASNLDSRNNYISDNAAIRAESADYIQWSVTQDDEGRGRFIYNALLPLVNPNPLKDKQSIIERIWSYSPYDPNLNTESGILGYGYELPVLPTWVDTTERLLAYLGIFATLITKYARLTKGDEDFWANIHPEYWGECQYKISDSAYGGSMILSGTLSIDWNSYLDGKSLIRCLNPYSGHASDINCNFPMLDLLWSVSPVDLALPTADIIPLVPFTGPLSVGSGTKARDGLTAADAIINSYSQSYFNDEVLPDWLLQAGSDPSGNMDQLEGGSQVIGNATPQLIESLPVCKEQDPSMVSYATQLGEKIPTK